MVETTASTNGMADIRLIPHNPEASMSVQFFGSSLLQLACWLTCSCWCSLQAPHEWSLERAPAASLRELPPSSTNGQSWLRRRCSPESCQRCVSQPDDAERSSYLRYANNEN